MKREEYNFKGTVIVGDKVMSEEEFMSKPFEVSYQRNKKLIDDYAYATDAKYRQTKQYIKRFELVSERLARLEKEREEILNKYQPTGE